MYFRYRPREIITGPPYEQSQRVSAPYSVDVNPPAYPFGVQWLNAPATLAANVVLKKIREEGNVTILEAGGGAYNLWTGAKGRGFRVPIELEEGEILRVSYGGDGVAGTFAAWGLRPAQLRERKRQIRSFVGEEVTPGWANAELSLGAGETKRERVTIPSGEWVFDKVIAFVSTPNNEPSEANVTITMDSDEKELFDAPVGERELQFPVQRVEREMKIEVEAGPAEETTAQFLIPLYRADFLFDLAHNSR